MVFRQTRWLQFLAWVLLLALTWLVVLPWVGSRRQVRMRIEAQNAKGINPEAMFYTDLDVMDEILQQLNRRETD